MKRKVSLYVLLVLLIVALPVVLASAEENDCLLYFYGKDCKDCVDAKTTLNDLKVKYPNIEIKEKEVYYDRNNFRLLQKYMEAFNVPEDSKGVPIVFLTDSYFVGEAINNVLEGRILEHKGSSCASHEQATKAVGFVSSGKSYDVQETLNFFIVNKNAILDSFHSEALVALLLLLFILILVKEKKNALKKGFLFIGGNYVVYFLFGLGLIPWLNYSLIKIIFEKIVAVAALIFGSVLVYNFFKKLTWPAEMKKYQKYKEMMLSNKGLTCLGLLSGLLTFNSESKIFYILRNLIQEAPGRLGVFIYIIYYCLAFVALMLVANLFIFYIRKKIDGKEEVEKGTDEEKVEKKIEPEKKKTNKKMILNIPNASPLRKKNETKN